MRHFMIPLLASGLLAGCKVDDNHSLVIVQNQIPDEGCVLSGNIDNTFRSSGTLDVSPIPDSSINFGYYFTPVMRSGIAGNSDPNANLIVLQGADIELVAGPGEDSAALIDALTTAGLDKRTVRVSGSISPSGSSSIGFFAIDREQTNAIATQLTALAATTIIARVRVFGTVDEGEIVSGPFEYPITVCDGCLMRNVGSCSNIPSSSEVPAGGVCNLAQDTSLQCCDSGTSIRCPASTEDE